MKTCRIQNYIVTGILFLGTLAGAGYNYYRWRELNKGILSLDYINLASKSAKDAYMMVKEAAIYYRMFVTLGIAAGILLLVLAAYILITSVLTKKERNKLTGSE